METALRFRGTLKEKPDARRWTAFVARDGMVAPRRAGGRRSKARCYLLRFAEAQLVRARWILLINKCLVLSVDVSNSAAHVASRQPVMLDRLNPSE